MSRRVIVIGAGASGLMAAVTAARCGADVTVLEKMQQPGRKLLLTGNGRCNLSNLDPELKSAYRSSEDWFPGSPSPELEKLCSCAFEEADRDRVLGFFSSIGLWTRQKDGCLYPVSGQASSVLQVLLNALDSSRVKMRFNTRAESLAYNEERKTWQVYVPGYCYEADSVIVCAGSRAAPQTGSDGSGYDLAAACGHRICPVSPALTAIPVRSPFLTDAAGARTWARVTLKAEKDGEVMEYAQEGEVQWTKDALSGIVVFQLSGPAACACREGAEASLTVDLLPDHDKEELVSLISSLRHEYAAGKNLQDITLAKALSGLVHERVLKMLLRRLGLEKKAAALIEDHEIDLLAGELKSLTFPAEISRDFEKAQVCTGGVALGEINPRTLESKMRGGLYFAGEILDIDGPCGGYNLQWAWTSGMIAGRSAAKPPKEEEV